VKITTQNSFFLVLLFANLSTSSCKSSCLAASFSMLMSAKLSRRSCAIDERKYDFISFSFEKLRSALETVTGSVQNRMHAAPSSGIDDRTSDDSSRLFGLELGGPWHSGAPGHCPPCPPYCYATACWKFIDEWKKFLNRRTFLKIMTEYRAARFKDHGHAEG